MTKSEMLKNWKNTSAIKSQFGKVLGERYPHLCYTNPKLLNKINNTLQSLTEELGKVVDGEPEAKAKAEKPAKEPVAKDTKIAEGEVQVADASAKKPTKADSKKEVAA